MAAVFNSWQKMCVTCEYWSGCREVSRDGKQMLADIRDQEGTCRNSRSNWSGRTTLLQHNCPYHEKSSYLK